MHKYEGLGSGEGIGKSSLFSTALHESWVPKMCHVQQVQNVRERKFSPRSLQQAGGNATKFNFCRNEWDQKEAKLMCKQEKYFVEGGP